MKWVRIIFYYFYSAFELLFRIRNWLALLPIFLKPSSSGERLIRLRKPPITLAVRGAMDVWSVKETFLDAFYTRYGVPVQDGWVVVDIGAGIGDFSIYAAYGKPNTVVYAYEPFPESHQLLIKNLTVNAVDNVLAFQEAVWSNPGTLTLDLSAGEPLQIVSKESDIAPNRVYPNAVKAITLKDMLDGQGIKKVDLLKLDCEGAEYEILMKTPSEVLARIDRIIMEYHDRDEERHHSNLVQFLEVEGYHVTHQKNIVHDDIGYLFAGRQSDLKYLSFQKT